MLIEITDRLASAMNIAVKVISEIVGHSVFEPLGWIRSVQVIKESDIEVEIECTFWLFREPENIRKVLVIIGPVVDGRRWWPIRATDTKTGDPDINIEWVFDARQKPIKV